MKWIMLLLCATQAFVTIAQYNQENLKVCASGDRYKYENLQLYPIRATQRFLDHEKNANYKPLSEALKEQKIKITELGSGDVNKLYMENVSKDTIVILSGEVVQGGKQDRMVANDVILYPKQGKREVDVFCVEHGRWTSRQGNMSFDNYYSISSKEVRKAGTVNKNQSEVWDKVSETTTKNNASTSTGTLAALKNSNTYVKALKGYTDFFSKIITNESDVIGVVAVTGNVVMGCDMFASHELFTKHYISLVSSYASEAITNGNTIHVTPQAVQNYLADIIENEQAQDEKVLRKGTMLKNGSKKVHISTFD